MTDPVSRPGVSPSAAVEHAKRLLGVNPRLAEKQAREILKVLPYDARAVFIIAAARRRAGDVTSARKLLEPLSKADPNSADVHHELGLALARLGETDAAIVALRRAAALAPGLPEPWLSLSEQLRLHGDTQGADSAFAEHVRQSAKHPQLLEAAVALREGRLKDAEAVLRGYLAGQPQDVSALRMLGETAFRLGHHEDAEEILAYCLKLDPDYAPCRHNYALVLYELSRAEEAIPHVRRLLESAPGDVNYLGLLATCLGIVGDYAQSLGILEDLLRDYPSQPKLLVTYGQTLRILNRQPEAVAAIRQAIALRPGLGEAYWSLADIKTERFSEADIAQMRAQLDNPQADTDSLVHFNYALGKAFEDAKQWQASFAYYDAGARLRRVALAYSADQTTATRLDNERLFNRAFFDARADGGARDPSPIFVVGLPRSGSTLVEQILGRHSQIEATTELAAMNTLCGRLGRAGRRGIGPAYLDAIAALSASERTALGEQYLAMAQPYRRIGKPLFVDKMPSNFQHIGLIALILPNARIIDVRRHPMAGSFAVFKQHFFRGHGYSYNLTDVGRYYNDYVALTAHFDQVLPGRVHRVIYEDLVDNTEHQIRAMLDFCGVAFEPACARFWEDTRPVPTHSSQQVRQPIFRSAVDLWRNYTPWLQDLESALGQSLATWRGGQNASADL